MKRKTTLTKLCACQLALIAQYNWCSFVYTLVDCLKFDYASSVWVKKKLAEKV